MDKSQRGADGRLTHESLALAALLEVVPWRLDDWQDTMPADVIPLFTEVAELQRQLDERMQAMGLPYRVRMCLVSL